VDQVGEALLLLLPLWRDADQLLGRVRGRRARRLAGEPLGEQRGRGDRHRAGGTGARACSAAGLTRTTRRYGSSTSTASSIVPNTELRTMNSLVDCEVAASSRA
jgi:hypothetical protein